MSIRSFLILLIEDPELLKPVKLCWEVVQSKKDFAQYSPSRHKKRIDYFRHASRYRYSKELGNDKELSATEDEKLKVRYPKLDFWVFCFLAPYLSPKQVASISDELWPGFVELVSAHLKEISAPQEFATAWGERLVRKGEPPCAAFKEEWDQQYPRQGILVEYNKRLQQITKTFDDNLKSRLGDIAQQPYPNIVLKETGRLVAESRNQIREQIAQLKDDLLCNDNWIGSAGERVGTVIKGRLRDIAERSADVDDRLQKAQRLVAEFWWLLKGDSHEAPAGPGL